MNDLLELNGDVWQAYAFIHDLDDEFYSPLIFTEETIIGTGFAEQEVMMASHDLYQSEKFEWIPVGKIHKWERREAGLWATGKLYRPRDKAHMGILREIIRLATRDKLLALTYSGDKNLMQFVPGSKRKLARFPVLFLSFYFRRQHVTQKSTGTPKGIRPGD